MASTRRCALLYTARLALPVALSIYMEFENRVLVPRVYGRVMRLPSTVIILALVAGGTLMGVLGALLALPIAAGLLMMLEELRVEMPGDDSVDRSELARDAQGSSSGVSHDPRTVPQLRRT
jgi:predicted PurR-regulated permease PerM